MNFIKSLCERPVTHVKVKNRPFSKVRRVLVSIKIFKGEKLFSRLDYINDSNEFCDLHTSHFKFWGCMCERFILWKFCAAKILENKVLTEVMKIGCFGKFSKFPWENPLWSSIFESLPFVGLKFDLKQTLTGPFKKV